MKHLIPSVHKQTERFAQVTQRLIQSGNIPRVKKCLATAEKLLRTGNAETRTLISGLYLHSVSTFLELRGCRIAGLFPEALRAEYVKQINATAV